MRQTVGAAVTAQTAGDWLGLVPPGVSCPFVTVSGACNPDACRRQQQLHGDRKQPLAREQASASPGATAVAGGTASGAHQRRQHHLSPSIVHLPPPAPSRSGAAGLGSAERRGKGSDTDEYGVDTGSVRRNRRKPLSVSAQVWRAVASLAAALVTRAGRLVQSAAGVVHLQCLYRLSPRTCARLEQVGAAAPGITAAAALLAVALVSGLVRRCQQQAQRRRSDGRGGQQTGKASPAPAPASSPTAAARPRQHFTAWAPRSAAVAVAASVRGTSMPGAAGAGAGIGGSFADDRAAASRRYGRSTSVSGAAAGDGLARRSTSSSRVQPYLLAGGSHGVTTCGTSGFTAADVAPIRLLSSCYPSLASALTDGSDEVDIACRLFTHPAAAVPHRSKPESVSSMSSSSSAASAATSAPGAGAARAAKSGALPRVRGGSDSGRGHGPSATELVTSLPTDKAVGRAGRAATSSADGTSPGRRRVTFSGTFATAPAPQPQPKPSKARSLMRLPDGSGSMPASQPLPDLQLQQQQPRHSSAATCASILGSPDLCALEVKPIPRPARAAEPGLSLPHQDDAPPAQLMWSAPGAASATARVLKCSPNTQTSNSATGHTSARAAAATPPAPLARASCSGALLSGETMRLNSSGGGGGGGRGWVGRSISLKALSAPAPAATDGQVDAEAAAGADLVPAATASAALPVPLPPPPTFLRWSAGPTHTALEHESASAADTQGRLQGAAARRTPPANLRSAPLSRGAGSAGAQAYSDSLAAAAAAAATAAGGGRTSSSGGACSGGLQQPQPQLLLSAPPTRDPVASAAVAAVPQTRARSGSGMARVTSLQLPSMPPPPPPPGFLPRHSLSLTSRVLGPAATAPPTALPPPPPPLQQSPSVPLPLPPPSLLLRMMSQEAKRQAPPPGLIMSPLPLPHSGSSTTCSSEAMPCCRAESHGAAAYPRPGGLTDDHDDFVRSLSCGSACNARGLPSPMPAPAQAGGAPGAGRPSMGSPAGSDDASCGGSGGAGTSGSSGAASPESDSPACRNRNDCDSPVGPVVPAVTVAWDAVAKTEAGAPLQSGHLPTPFAAAAKPLPSVRLGPSAAELDSPFGSPRAVRRAAPHAGGLRAAAAGKLAAAAVAVAESQAGKARVAASAFAGMQTALQAAADARTSCDLGSTVQADLAPPFAPSPVRTLAPQPRTLRFTGADSTGGCSSSCTSSSCGVAANSLSFRIPLHPCASTGADAADAVATPVLRGARRWSLTGVGGTASATLEEQVLLEAQPLQQQADSGVEAGNQLHLPHPPVHASAKVALPLPPPPFLRPLPLPVPKQRP